MASESLSQNEIDALLGGGRPSPAPEAVATEVPKESRGEAHLYDFRRPRRISVEKLRSLEAMYERFTKSLEGWLVSRVRGKMQLALQSVEQFSFGEFTVSLPTPCASYTFEIKETGGQQGVIDFGHEFAYFLVDRLFGGASEATIPARALTPLERMAVRSVADRALAFLAEIWQDYCEMELGLVGFESIPEILRVANREDPVLVANIEVTVEQTRSLLLICLPFAVLEKFFAGGNERRVTVLGSPEEQVTNRERAEHSLRSTRLQVSARLPEFRLSMREFCTLQPGSVISTGIPRNADIDVFIGAQRRYLASPGRVGSALAVRLAEGILPPPEPITIPINRQ